MKYAVVIENAGTNFSAYVPDLPGCIATGATMEETERNISSAIQFHLDGMKKEGLPIPSPTSAVEYVEVAA
jgi:predicted RNase H-like HicB family nuclease